MNNDSTKLRIFLSVPSFFTYIDSRSSLIQHSRLLGYTRYTKSNGKFIVMAVQFTVSDSGWPTQAPSIRYKTCHRSAQAIKLIKGRHQVLNTLFVYNHGQKTLRHQSLTMRHFLLLEISWKALPISISFVQIVSLSPDNEYSTTI